MTWIARLFRRRTLEDQLDRELRYHLEEHAADLIAAGLDPAEARRQARLAIGGPEQVKEGCRDARGTRWLDDLWQDLRYALRVLRQKPGFAAVTFCTLGLGIGAATVMFSVVNGVLLTPLHYSDPARLVAVHGNSPGWNEAVFGAEKMAYLDFLDCRRECRAVDVAGVVFNRGTLSAPGDPEYVIQFEATANFFSVLGVPLYRGREFLPQEDAKGGSPVAILGYSLWQHHFGANASVLGATLTYDTKPYTIVGIASPGVEMDGTEPDLYTPVGQDPAPYLQFRRARPVNVIGRLKRGVTLAQARTELGLLGRNLAEKYPATNKGRTFQAQAIQPNVGDIRSTLLLLLGAVGLVLLIACVNVASLLLARAVSRERELAMRVALGAGRGRLIRQCLTESAVFGLGGGVLGLVLAAIGMRPFVALWPGDLPRAQEVHLDWRVLLFAIGVSLCAGLLFGLAPALRVPTRVLEQTLRAGARTVAGSARRVHAAFVVCEIALTVVLLVSTAMFGRTLLRLSSLNPGVDIDNVLVTRVALSPSVLANPARTRAAWDDFLARAAATPGVDSIAIVDTVPMRSGNNPLGYWPTPAVPEDGKRPMALASSVTPNYLKVMRLPLLSGRFFDDRDRLDSAPVVVIDEVMARNTFGSIDAVGKRLWIPDMGKAPLEVVGVVGHVRYWGLAGDDQAQVRAQFYYPWSQVPDAWMRRWSELMSVAVRTTVPPLTLVAPLRREVRAVANDQVLYQVRTLQELAAQSIALQYFLMVLFGVFAGLSLLLASIGIYGVLAYLTGRRIPEFGIRMALGATAGNVIRLVLRQSLAMILTGLGAGLAFSLAAARLLVRLVEGMQSGGVAAFAITVVVLMVAALFASFLPARRASRIDPVTALRQE